MYEVERHMLKISMSEGQSQRRLIVEGRLVPPFAAELKAAWDKAAADLDGRELVIELKNLTTISPQGEDVLLELMKCGAKFRCCGVFTKHVLREVARRMGRNGQEEHR